MASFEYVNYYLRTNKNIERKIIFESLNILNKVFEIQNFRYIGLGGLWFVDFILAHKELGIENLISIEKDAIGFSRANFNKPLNCVFVKEGESSLILPEIDFREKPVIVWFDYDQDFGSAPATDDIQIICEKALSGSIIVITLNAHPYQLKRYMPQTQDTINQIEAIVNTNGISEGDKLQIIEGLLEKTKLTAVEKRKNALNSMAGNLVPSDLSEHQLAKEFFPELLAKIIFNHIYRTILVSGRKEKFYPLYNYRYRDSTPMITVGGMIANNDDALSIQKSHIRYKRYITTKNGDRQFEINAPPLTIKEKIELDQLMPSNTKLGVRKIKKILNLKFNPKQLASYEEFYLYYPIYGELEI